ncbi:MAG TPA: hypothetical protein VF173_18680 [Thermoanaerobaculia bacterium]|nr:hypothetical protein [Thermoanaerobaculia bacterium]
MEPSEDSPTEILHRLSGVLPAVFFAFGIPREKAEKIVETALLVLVYKKRMRIENPERRVLRFIIDVCCREAAKEELGEDPPP